MIAVGETPTTPCRVWRGCTNSKGYGSIRRGGRTWSVHRYVYFLCTGIDLPASVHLRHACDNVACYRLDHLVPGSNQDNVDDRVAKRRSARKLNDDQVAEIRRLYADGLAAAEIAERFGVADSLVSQIASGKIHRHLGGPVSKTRRQPVDCPELRAAIRAALDAGTPLRSVAVQFGCNRRTIYKIIKRMES